MKRLQFRKLAIALVAVMFGFQAFAQGRIDLNPQKKGAQEATNVTATGFSATFSFNSIESQSVTTEKGVFSALTMDNTYQAGNIGDPSLPTANKLIAVPFGVKDVKVTVKNYTTTVYNLSDYGINTVAPMQIPLRKDQKPEDIPFSYNEKAYNLRGFAERPICNFAIEGTMRGIQIGALTINPVEYDAASNTIRVHNDIEVEVSFADYDETVAYSEFARTFSPYYTTIYSQFFNSRAINDIYDEHPDLWQSPVKMLVVANRMFEAAMEEWIAWKTMKGFYMDVHYTDEAEVGTSAASIKSFITSKYNEEAPTFVMIIGDKDQVAPSKTASQATTNCVSDLNYMSIDGDEFPEMFHSRFPAENVAQFQAMINKSLQYEQLTMPDPSYLGNVLLIAGEDSGWGVTVGRPAIWYATNYYYNTDHGFANVYEYSHGQWSGCYSHLNTGVGFVNYTAHGSNTSWAGPSLTNSDVNNLTNTDKYFLAMGNCCQAADWGISGACFGETMVRAENKAAYAYIGSCPSTYWLNDYYFAVGATNRADGTMPSYEETTFGCYDAIWTDNAYNTVCAIPYVGNLAGNAAGALGYTLHVETLYCWEAYHVLGDGSVLPYRIQPVANDVSHLPILPIGMDFFEVSAEPGSYVGISKDGVLYGAGTIDESGTTNIALTPITSGGDVTICVTHPNCIPSIETIPAAAMEGPFISVNSFTPGNVPCNEEQSMSITFKNVGADPTTGTTNVVLTCDDANLTIVDGEGSFGTINPDETITLTDEFSFIVAPGVADNTKITINVTSTCGSDTWAGKATVVVGAPIVNYVGFQWAGLFEPGETYPVIAKFENKGHYMANNAVVTISSASSYLSFAQTEFNVGTIEVGGEGTALFYVTIDPSCPTTEQMPLTFTLTADNGVSAEGEGVMKNTCNVVFHLHDSWGDGWNGCKLIVAFSDGTPSQDLTIASGNSADYTLEIGTGVHVTVTFQVGQYASETSFEIEYEGGEQIYASQGTPTAGVACQFDVNCAGDAPIILDPVTNLAAIADGHNAVVTWDAPESALSYIVKRNGTVVADALTETTFVDEELVEGSYTYMVIAVYADGESMPAAVQIDMDYTGVEENETNFMIYPNPAENVLNIVSNGQVEYQLVNSIGQVVMSGNANGEAQLNVSSLNGMYILKVVADGNTSVRKVIVK
ncbi:MAG: C25 family cysteine peptidase [Bacteroidia bacterium]|nr:C25 family cysteine peptidase [Bacteroidia bacterium]